MIEAQRDTQAQGISINHYYIYVSMCVISCEYVCHLEPRFRVLAIGAKVLAELHQLACRGRTIQMNSGRSVRWCRQKEG